MSESVRNSTNTNTITLTKAQVKPNSNSNSNSNFGNPSTPSRQSTNNSSRRSHRRRQKQKQKQILATTQIATTAMFCPVPWFATNPIEEEYNYEKGFHPQEYLSYRSKEGDVDDDDEIQVGVVVATDSDESVDAPGEEKDTEAPSTPAVFKTVDTAPCTAQTVALTPEAAPTATTTEENSNSSVEDDSVEEEEEPKEASPVRPRTLSFEESMKTIEKELQEDSVEDVGVAVTATDDSKSTVLSPLKVVVLAIVLALLSSYGVFNFEPAAAIVDTRQETVLPAAASIEQAADVPKSAAVEDAAMEDVVSIEEEVALEEADEVEAAEEAVTTDTLSEDEL